MAMTDPLADMLTRIRNGINAKKLVVECPDSNLKISVLKVLLKEGFIRGYNKKENDLWIYNKKGKKATACCVQPTFKYKYYL